MPKIVVELSYIDFYSTIEDKEGNILPGNTLIINAIIEKCKELKIKCNIKTVETD